MFIDHIRIMIPSVNAINYEIELEDSFNYINEFVTWEIQNINNSKNNTTNNFYLQKYIM